MRKRLQLFPGGRNFYEDPRRVITPIQSGVQYPIAVDFINKKEEIVKKHFRVDFFLMLAEAQRQMTATEIIERQSEKAAVLGATIGRLQSDCLDPIIDRVFRIEYDAGRLPKVPESLLEYGGRGMRVDYLGPLAQAQKRHQKASPIINTLVRLSQIAEFKPEILDNYDWDVVAREISDSEGFPQDAILEPKVVAKIRDARAKMVQQQQQMEQAKEMVEAVPKLSKKIEKGSVLDELRELGAGTAS
jgi:hypothetical protein